MIRRTLVRVGPLVAAAALAVAGVAGAGHLTAAAGRHVTPDTYYDMTITASSGSGHTAAPATYYDL